MCKPYNKSSIKSTYENAYGCGDYNTTNSIEITSDYLKINSKTLDEIIASGSQEDLEKYYAYLDSMKTNSFYRDIVESYEGASIAEITYKIMEEEQNN